MSNWQKSLPSQNMHTMYIVLAKILFCRDKIDAGQFSCWSTKFFQTIKILINNKICHKKNCDPTWVNEALVNLGEVKFEILYLSHCGNKDILTPRWTMYICSMFYSQVTAISGEQDMKNVKRMFWVTVYWKSKYTNKSMRNPPNKASKVQFSFINV